MEEFFKKQAAEDSVEYLFYHQKSFTDSNFAKTELQQLIVECQAFVAKETLGYIWQNQTFNIVLSERSGIPCLSGSTNFGDLIADEWFIVYLIHQITKYFDQLIATVHDNDGEFLLIEAAEFLPGWISPNSSLNRVFISRGFVHIIMKPETPAEIPVLPVNQPTLSQSLSAIANWPWITQAPTKILSCIGKRTNIFPEHALDQVFHVNVYLNRKLVYILDEFPQLISSSIQAFYFRDPVDLRACRQFKYFPPDDRVWTTIPMNKCHYAQLQQQHFVADRRSRYRVNDSLPLSLKKGYDLGMKVCHGFEILCSKLEHGTDPVECELMDKQQKHDFVTTLTKIGYFKNELEGSRKYKQLLKHALQFAQNSEMSQNTPTAKNPALCKIMKIFKQFENMTIFPKLINLEIHEAGKVPEQNGDDWMYLGDSDVHDLVSEMNKGFKHFAEFQSCDNMEGNIMTSLQKVSSFVENISSYEGVELKEESTVKLEANLFLKSMSEMLNLGDDVAKKPDVQTDTNSEDFLSDETSSTDDEEFLNDSSHKASHDMVTYMQQMDRELIKTEVGKSFRNTEEKSPPTLHDEHGSRIDDSANIDINLAQNFLQGIQDEVAMPGPVSSILGSLGVKLHNVDIVN